MPSEVRETDHRLRIMDVLMRTKIWLTNAGADDQTIDLDAPKVWPQDDHNTTVPDHVDSPLDTASPLMRLFFEQVSIAL